MADESNPFDPPLNTQESNSHRFRAGAVKWILSGILALATGAAYYLANARADEYIFFVIYGPPVGYLCLSALNIAGGQSRLEWRMSALIKPAFMGTLFCVAAYIAFATTCCFTNIAIDGFSLYPEMSHMLRGSVVTVGSTFLGCWVVLATRRWQVTDGQGSSAGSSS